MSEQRDNRGTGTTQSVGSGNAGASGALEGETGLDSSGLSGDKGVHGTGDASKPTSKGKGLRVGESEWDKPTGDQNHTLEAQLREKGFVDGDNAPSPASDSQQNSEDSGE